MLPSPSVKGRWPLLGPGWTAPRERATGDQALCGLCACMYACMCACMCQSESQREASHNNAVWASSGPQLTKRTPAVTGPSGWSTVTHSLTTYTHVHAQMYPKALAWPCLTPYEHTWIHWKHRHKKKPTDVLIKRTFRPQEQRPILRMKLCTNTHPHTCTVGKQWPIVIWVPGQRVVLSHAHFLLVA